MAPVQCGKCGHLAIRDYKTRELLEVDELMRSQWHPFVIPTGEINPCDQPQLCSALAAPLVAEITFDPHGRPIPKSVLATLYRDRECASFCTWIPGFDPKEHKEMMHQEELRRMDQEQRRFDRRWNFYILLINIFVAAIVGYVASLLPRPQWQPAPQGEARPK